MDSDTTGRVIYLSLLLLAVAGSVITGFRQSPGKTLQQLLIWGFIFLGLVAAYGLWPDLRRALHPQAATVRDGAVELRLARDGHFHAEVTVNGTPLSLLVDTGASDIVLSRDDAARVGIDMGALDFTGSADTANGRVATAKVRLDQLTLGPFTDRDVPARVNDGAMEGSLLGMSYLGRFTIAIDGPVMRLGR